MSSENINKTLNAGILMIIATLFSRIIGFIKEMIIGAEFGATANMDAYLVATLIPLTIFTSLIVAVTTAYIPLYSEVVRELGDIKANKFTNNLINIVIVISVGVIIIVFLCAESISKVMARGFSEEILNLTGQLIRIAIPSVVFIGISQIFIAFSNCNNRFFMSSLVNIPNSICIIIIIMFFGDNIQLLTFSCVLGSIIQVIFNIFIVKKEDYKYNFIIDINDEYIKKLFKLFIPVLMATAIQQLSYVIDRNIGSGLPVGSIASLNYSNKIIGFAFGLTSMCIATISFPLLSNCKDTNKFNKISITSLNLVTMTTMPLIGIVCVFSKNIVRILFERGAFDKYATNMTAQALLAYSIGMVFFGYRDVLNRIYYSRQDTKTPMINSLWALILNVVISITLSKKLGHIGIALGTSISAIVTTILLINDLRKNTVNLNLKDIYITFFKSFFSTIILCILSKCIYNILIIKAGEFLSLLISCVLGIGIYLILLKLFKIKEVNIVVNNIKRLYKK